jgi:hypothetical protein
MIRRTDEILVRQGVKEPMSKQVRNLNDFCAIVTGRLRTGENARTGYLRRNLDGLQEKVGSDAR